MGKIVTRSDRVANAAESFLQWERYPEYWTKGWPHLSLPPASETYAGLAELGTNPDPDAVDKVSGRTLSFATCDNCGNEAGTVVEFDFNCGEFALELCGPCCASLARKIAAKEG